MVYRKNTCSGEQAASDAESVDLGNMEPNQVDQEIAKEDTEINRLQVDAHAREKHKKLKQLQSSQKESAHQQIPNKIRK